MNWINEAFGEVKRLRLFVTMQGELVGDIVLVAESTTRKNENIEWKYVRRIGYCDDWLKEEKRLLMP